MDEIGRALLRRNDVIWERFSEVAAQVEATREVYPHVRVPDRHLKESRLCCRRVMVVPRVYDWKDDLWRSCKRMMRTLWRFGVVFMVGFARAGQPKDEEKFFLCEEICSARQLLLSPGKMVPFYRGCLSDCFERYWPYEVAGNEK